MENTFIPILITIKALEDVKIIMNSKKVPDAYGLRIGVRRTGCGSSSHTLGFDRKKENDLEFVKKIFAGLYKENIFHMKDILEFLNNNPAIRKINSHHKRNEGYEKSIQDD